VYAFCYHWFSRIEMLRLKNFHLGQLPNTMNEYLFTDVFDTATL